jgi:FixJ family two-component response regulator
VDDRIVAGWTSFLDQAEGVLEGRLLLPHWRFPSTQGVNLRRMFEEPRTLDPIMIVTGAGAIPYIETGEIAAGSTLDTGMGLLEGGLLAYFLWFN